MKNLHSLLCGAAITSAALLLTACGGSSRMTKSTSSRMELAHTVRLIPSQAALAVSPERVTATIQSYELESLDAEQARQTVVAKALATVNGDVLLAPRFSSEKTPDGKISSLTVVGYAATVSSFRPVTETDVVIPDSLTYAQHPMHEASCNTMTVADVEYAEKASVSLTAAELTGKNEETALQMKFGTNNAPMTQADLKEMARAAALQKYNADLLLNETFYFDYQDKIITHVTICGTPAVYANFRPLQKDEVADIKLVPITGDTRSAEKTKDFWIRFWVYLRRNNR